MAKVAGARWQVEKCLEEGKGETGLDEYEVRNWPRWHRHTLLSMMAHAWLASLRSRECQPDPPSREEPEPREGGETNEDETKTSFLFSDPSPQELFSSTPIETPPKDPLQSEASLDCPAPVGSATKVLAELTVPEIRRLLEVALPSTLPSMAFILAWSWFRRRSRQLSKESHYRRRANLHLMDIDPLSSTSNTRSPPLRGCRIRRLR